MEQKLSLKDFESWAYENTALSERMDEDAILEVFAFNYNQDGAFYIFRETFFPFIDREEFMLWKIKSNLSDLAIGTQQRERILNEFCNLGYRGYTFLYDIGMFLYSFEDTYYYSATDVKELQKKLSVDASRLLIEIETRQKEEGFSISRFGSSQESERIASDVNGQVWWRMWS